MSDGKGHSCGDITRTTGVRTWHDVLLAQDKSSTEGGRGEGNTGGRGISRRAAAQPHGGGIEAPRAASPRVKGTGGQPLQVCISHWPRAVEGGAAPGLPCPGICDCPPPHGPLHIQTQNRSQRFRAPRRQCCSATVGANLQQASPGPSWTQPLLPDKRRITAWLEEAVQPPQLAPELAARLPSKQGFDGCPTDLG